jgi:hypothetical protein
MFCDYIYKLFIIILNYEYKYTFKNKWIKFRRKYFVRKRVHNFGTFESASFILRLFFFFVVVVKFCL